MASDTTQRRCEKCKGAMPPGYHRTRDKDGKLSCPMCSSVRRWNTTAARMVMHPDDVVEFDRREVQTIKTLGERRRTIQRTAHGMGDLDAIRHCPRCGSGDVIAGSDGSTNCGFCQLNFTVQVQPQFNAMPQSVDGQPFQDPSVQGTPTTDSVSPFPPAAPAGMPGAPGDPAAAAGGMPGEVPPGAVPLDDPAAAGAAADPAAAGAPAPGGIPGDINGDGTVDEDEAKIMAEVERIMAGGGEGEEEDPDAKPEDEEEDDEDKKPPFLSTLRRLALAHADDPAEMLDIVRGENGLAPWGSQ